MAEEIKNYVYRVEIKLQQFFEKGPIIEIDLAPTDYATRLEEPFPLTVKALIDTGASTTTITDEIAQELQLTSIGNTTVDRGGGYVTAASYQIFVRLPNTGPSAMLTVIAVPLDSLKLHQGACMLIGRDLLAQGVTTYDAFSECLSLVFRC